MNFGLVFGAESLDMLNGLNALGKRLKWTTPIWVLGVLGALIALGVDILMNTERFLYPALLTLIWSVLLLVFVWWFQPAEPNAVLLTTALGRFKARMQKLMGHLKVWLFLLMLIGAIGLTVRFVTLW